MATSTIPQIPNTRQIGAGFDYLELGGTDSAKIPASRVGYVATTASDLRALTVSVNNADFLVNMLGSSTVGDGNGGTFRFDATSTATDDGVSVVKPNMLTTGRWLRVGGGGAGTVAAGGTGNTVAPTALQIVTGDSSKYVPKDLTVDSTSGMRTVFGISQIVLGCDHVAVDNKTSLKAFPRLSLTDGQVATLRGASAVGDGSGAQYVWSASSSATDNGDTVLAPSIPGATGRWLKINTGSGTAGVSSFMGRTGAVTLQQSDFSGVSIVSFGTYFKNVLDYGADNTGATFSTTAIQNAINACPSGGTVYLPPGNYKSGALTIGAKNILILGAGVASTQILFNGNSADCISKTSTTGAFEISDIRLYVDSSVTASWLMKITATSDYPRTIRIHDVEWYIASATGGIYIDCPTDGHIFDVRGQNAGGGCGLRLIGGISVNDSYVSVGGSATNPCVWLTANPLTSSSYSNSTFGGGGPAKKFTISGIASTSSNFTVTTSAAHSFAVGDAIVIRGASVAGYNSVWEVASVATNTVTVTSTLSLGSATGGTLQSISACFLVDNSIGPMNESRIINCLFENFDSANRVYGSASLLFDARQSSSQVFGWDVSNCYYDYGSISVMLDGKNDNLTSINLNGGHLQCDSYGVFVRNANNVLVSNMQLGKADSSGTTQLTPNSCGIAIVGTSAQGGSSGVMVSDCNLVSFNEGTASTSLHNYGVYISGDSVNDLSIKNNKIHGINYAITDASTVALVDKRWTISGNRCSSTSTWPIASYTRFRPLITSGSGSSVTLDLGFDAYKLIGADITNLSGSFCGRSVKFIVNTDSVLRSGGNILLSGDKSLRAGSVVDVICENDGYWYVTGFVF